MRNARHLAPAGVFGRYSLDEALNMVRSEVEQGFTATIRRKLDREGEPMYEVLRFAPTAKPILALSIFDSKED